MRRINMSEDDSEDDAPWMMTFTDMTTLLLTFFVMLISMAVFKSSQMEKAIDSLKKAFGLVSVTKYKRTEEEKTLDLFTKIAQKIKKIEKVNVIMTMKGLKLELKNPVLFDSGDAELRPEAKKILDRITDILRAYNLENYEINVSGHTDNVPIQTPKFPSNWELSTTRATNVLKYLIKAGLPPERMSASGYAEYRPIASNKTEEGRAKNRRMEILILKKYREEEKKSVP